MLHNKNTVRDALEDDVFASTDLSVAMPKYRFPEKKRSPATPIRWCTTN